MKSAQSLDIGTLVQIAETLESIVSRCFGPNGGLVLFTKATGEVLLTRDGKKILHSLLLDHPVARVLVDCVSVHCSMTGDGAKSFILLLSALLRGLQASVEKGTGRQTTCHNSSGRGKQASQEVRQVANCLLTFQTQYVSAFQGAFRMLQQTCEPVGLWNSHRLHSKHSVRSAHKTSCSLKSSLKSGNDTAADRSSDCHDDQCPAIEELHCSSASVDDEKRMEGTVKREPRKLQSKRYDCSGPLNGTNISGHGSDENSQDSTESGSCPQQSRPTSDASNELTVQRKSVLFSDPVNNVLEKCCRITVGNFEAMGQVFNQKPPETLIEAGSILPVGGVFEFLLHHYLKLYSKQDVESDTKTACNIIADAVLNIPRSVYKEKGTNRQFLEVHTKFARDIKIKGQICGWLDFNESVSCKYQLLVSVLQCLHTLVSLDFLVHSSRRTRTGVECESEDSD
nr:PREDICTED: Bardet-Biedl syndrome 10 protein isoform X3 [Lepisosteus oculatus]